MVVGRMREIALGRPVYSADGEQLGTVKDVQLDAFKVDAPMQPDYWLPMRCVVSTGSEGLRLDFVKDHLGDVRIDNPASLGPA
jgi:uncharacterized protein YrrD